MLTRQFAASGIAVMLIDLIAMSLEIRPDRLARFTWACRPGHSSTNINVNIIFVKKTTISLFVHVVFSELEHRGRGIRVSLVRHARKREPIDNIPDTEVPKAINHHDWEGHGSLSETFRQRKRASHCTVLSRRLMNVWPIISSF